MNHYNKSEKYKELVDLLVMYRGEHNLDRAANSSVQLLLDDLVINLRDTTEAERRMSEALIDEKEHFRTLEHLDDIIRGYGIPDDASVENIILALAEDGYIDAQNEDEYYRAVEAAERYLAEYGQWEGLQ